MLSARPAVAAWLCAGPGARRGPQRARGPGAGSLCEDNTKQIRVCSESDNQSFTINVGVSESNMVQLHSFLSEPVVMVPHRRQEGCSKKFFELHRKIPDLAGPRSISIFGCSRCAYCHVVTCMVSTSLLYSVSPLLTFLNQYG